MAKSTKQEVGELATAVYTATMRADAAYQNVSTALNQLRGAVEALQRLERISKAIELYQELRAIDAQGGKRCDSTTKRRTKPRRRTSRR